MTGSTEALVMAGGKGTRLLPYTAVLPKPLLPVGDAPVLERLLRQLRTAGLRRLSLAVHHHRQLIEAYFGDGGALGLDITYVVEDRPLGTCGAVSLVLDGMTEDFLLLNADLVTDLDFAVLRAHHRARDADLTMAVQARRVTQEFGVVELDPQGAVTALREKPSTLHHLVMGAYVLRRDAVRRFLPPGQRIDMPDLVTALLAGGFRVEALVTDGLWLDIGRPDDYARAQALAAAGAA
ncbi:MAG: NTP transferase domain-containing protein [Blastomonas sp.]|nr:NTP transferase domain-containing protein [Blastomonas sp.]